MKHKKDRTLREDIEVISKGIQTVYRMCPQFLIFHASHEIMSTIAPYFSLYMSSVLINELTGTCNKEKLLFVALLTIVGVLLINLSKRFLNAQRALWWTQLYQRHELFLMDAQNKFQYQYLEDAEVHLTREKIFAGCNANNQGIMQLCYSVVWILNGAFQVLVSLSLTLTIFSTSVNSYSSGIWGFINSGWATLLFGAIVCMHIVVSVKIKIISTKKINEAWTGLAKSNTIVSAYASEWGSDITIMDLKKIIVRELEKVLDKPMFLKEIEALSIKYESLQKAIQVSLNTVIFLYTAAKTYLGIFGIGNFILYRGTIGRLTEGISLIAECWGVLRFNNQYVLRELDYLNLPDQMYKGTLAVEKREDLDYEIEFQNVSFRYPNTENWALRNVNMKFKIGDKLAIVGENGSGKSTFIKLLCRLYDPTEGKILLNGIDITRYRFDEYMSLFSVVFQDYRLFQFSIAENVAASMEYDEERVKESLVKAGFGERMQKLDKGIHTVLGRDYENDGISLSGGEEQKLALARALYKDAPFVILDEPTAALDPIAEAEVYESFNRIVANKTAVYISHRLSSCRFCDEIAVFDKGQIVENGTHDVLVSKKGKYQELWEAQAKYYREETAGSI